MRTLVLPIKTLLLSALVLSSCTSSKNEGGYTVTFKSQKGDPLAQVGSTTFTVDELREDFLQRQGNFKGSPNLNTDKTRSEYLENQVTQEAMFQEAVSLGYLDKPNVRRDVKKIVVQEYMRNKLEEAQTKFEPTEQMMKDHYDKNQKLYNRGEALKVGFISVPFGSNQANAKKAATLIHKDALAKVKNGNAATFSRVPMDNQDAISALGISTVETNESDYLEKAEFEKKFGAGSFDSVKSTGEVGQVGSMASVNNYYIVMMKTGYRKALNETYEQAKEKISKRLAYENRGDYYKTLVEELKKKYNIKIYEDRVADLSKDALDTNVAMKVKEVEEKAKAEADAAKAPAAVPAKEQPQEAAPPAETKKHN